MPETYTLKTCPCCGGKVAIDDPDAYRHGVGYRVECRPCNLSMWSFRGEKPTSLVARWNTRSSGSEK